MKRTDLEKRVANRQKEKIARMAAFVIFTALGLACSAVAAPPEGGVDDTTKDRVLTEVSRMVAKSLRPLSDDAARQACEENFLFVSNLLQKCELGCRFIRLDDGTPMMFDSIGGCEGAYGEIPCHLAIDDKYVHGGALFPEANKTNTNVVEFVALANRVVTRGSFEYDPEFGFVMYTHSMPVSAIRSKGKTALGMAWGFPVMEVDLYSEAYKAVLDGEKTPEEAMKIVSEKIKKIDENESERVEQKPSKEAASLIGAYFRENGRPASPAEEDGRIVFSGTLTSRKADGMNNDGYAFRLIVGDDWVTSRVWLPHPVSNHEAQVSAFVALMNKRLDDSSSVLLFDEKDGSVACRAQIHVVELMKCIDDSMIVLLCRPVDILEGCSVAIGRIVGGAIDAKTAVNECCKSSDGGLVVTKTSEELSLMRGRIEKAWYRVRHATNDAERIEGVAVIREFAAARDHRAESLLGYCHEEGLGCERDLEKAYGWYLLAAEGGRADAQMKVGYLTETLKNDITNAVIWYRRGAEGGNARAQCNLANCLRLGRGVEKDGAAAIEWYRKSAAQGDEEGQYNLGVCCYTGLFCEKDDATALRLFQEAARRGHEDAAGALKRLGVEIDPSLTNGVGWAAQDLEALVGNVQPRNVGLESGESPNEKAATLSKRVRDILDEYDVEYKYEPLGEVIRCTFEVGGKIGQINFILQCRETCVACYLVHPVRADALRRDEMAKLLIRLNYDEEEHTYVMDYGDGEILLKATLASEAVLQGDVERFRDFMSSGVPIVQKGFDAVLSVALGIKTAEEACQKE